MTAVTTPPPGTAPALTDLHLPEHPEQLQALVLVLHGGAERTTEPVDGRSLSWRRARALARAVSSEVLDDGVGVVVMRYRVKGWNARPGALPAPVPDARWALQEVRERFGELPVVLLGHSMGARTSVAVADDPAVRGVVALAPWLPDGEPIDPLRGKVLRAAHGSGDKITSAKATRHYVERADAIADATFTDMGRVGHYLLRRIPSWNRFAVDGVREVLGR